MDIFKPLLVALLTLNTYTATAAYNQSSQSEVTLVAAYSRSSAPGDILIRLANPHVDCVDGYYVQSDSANKDAILSIALAAYHAKTNVLIAGYDEPNWRGSSSNNTCEIEGIVIVN